MPEHNAPPTAQPPHLDALSQKISIHVKCMYLEAQSEPEHQQYVFAYTVRIENHSDEQVQLLNRHWIVSDGDNNVKEVRGPGVVGEQPVIAAGAAYTYSSGSVMSSHYGTMAGSYEMVNSKDEHFDVTIPTFLLITPDKLN